MPSRGPNFLFIGPDKSGSTWLYEALRQHRQVFLPRVKELFFFDQFYDKGWSWYSKYFQSAGEQHHIVAEICHDYLFSPLACQRIAHDLPSAKLMVCLREPAQRAFSEFLYRTKVGLLDCDFETALEKAVELIDHGRYAQCLGCYLEHFKRDQIFAAVFDDLAANPQRFFDSLCDFLGIEHVILSSQLQERVLPAAKPRLPRVTKFAREISWKIRRMGLPGVVGKIKESTLLHRFLYSPYGPNEKPQMSSSTREFLHGVFTTEVQQLDALLGSNLSARWGYTEGMKPESLDGRPRSLAVHAASQSDLS
jgi:sulfotransferase family protein